MGFREKRVFIIKGNSQISSDRVMSSLLNDSKKRKLMVESITAATLLDERWMTGQPVWISERLRFRLLSAI